MSGGRYTSRQGSSGYSGGVVGSGPGYGYNNRPNGGGQIPSLMSVVNSGGFQRQNGINGGYGDGRFQANVYCHGGGAATGSGFPEYWSGSGGGGGYGYIGIASGGIHLPGPGHFTVGDADGGFNAGNNNCFIRKTYGGEANLQSKLQAMADSGSGGARGGFGSRVGVSTRGGGRGGEADMKKFAAYQLNNKRRRDDGGCAGILDHSSGVG